MKWLILYLVIGFVYTGLDLPKIAKEKQEEYKAKGDDLALELVPVLTVIVLGVVPPPLLRYHPL